MLEKMYYNIFQNDNSLTKIDIPSNLKELVYDLYNYLFVSVTNLTCFSYLGSTDFSNAHVFKSGNNPTVHVSDLLYPKNKQFGQRDVVRDGETCGVSNDPFSGKNNKQKKNCICTVLVIKQRPNLTSALIFLLASWNRKDLVYLCVLLLSIKRIVTFFYCSWSIKKFTKQNHFFIFDKYSQFFSEKVRFCQMKTSEKKNSDLRHML